MSEGEKGLPIPLCHVKLGERPAAERLYRRCPEVLVSRLGIAPSLETEAVHDALLKQPGLPRRKSVSNLWVPAWCLCGGY